VRSNTGPNAGLVSHGVTNALELTYKLACGKVEEIGCVVFVGVAMKRMDVGHDPIDALELSVPEHQILSGALGFGPVVRGFLSVHEYRRPELIGVSNKKRG